MHPGGLRVGRLLQRSAHSGCGVDSPVSGMVEAGEACNYQAQLQRHLRHRLADRQGGDALTQRVLLRVGDAPAEASQVSQLRHTDVSRRKSAVPRTCCPCEASNADSPRSSGTGWPAAAHSRPPSHAQRARPSEKRGGCQCRACARCHTKRAYTRRCAGLCGCGDSPPGRSRTPPASPRPAAEPLLDAALPGRSPGRRRGAGTQRAPGTSWPHAAPGGMRPATRRVSERLPAWQCRRLSPLQRATGSGTHTRRGIQGVRCDQSC